MSKLFDVYPADVQPRPPEIAPGIRIRAVGFPEGLVLIWDAGRSRTTERMDIHGEPGVYTNMGGQLAGYVVSRASGCACGTRKVKSAQVFGVEPVAREAAPAARAEVAPDPEPEPEEVVEDEEQGADEQ